MPFFASSKVKNDPFTLTYKVTKTRSGLVTILKVSFKIISQTVFPIEAFKVEISLPD